MTITTGGTPLRKTLIFTPETDNENVLFQEFARIGELLTGHFETDTHYKFCRLIVRKERDL